MGREGVSSQTIIGTGALTFVAILVGARSELNSIFLREYTRESRRAVWFVSYGLSGRCALYYFLDYLVLSFCHQLIWMVHPFWGLTLTAMILPNGKSVRLRNQFKAVPYSFREVELFSGSGKMANDHPCRTSQCITRNFYGNLLSIEEVCGETGRCHSHCRLLSGDAHFPFFRHSNNGCPFLHPCQREFQWRWLTGRVAAWFVCSGDLIWLAQWLINRYIRTSNLKEP